MPLRSWIADRRVVVAAIALVWLITRMAILDQVDPDSTDVELYFRYAVQGVDQQHVPYGDFDVEYPPVAYWFVALPRLIDRTPVPADTFDEPLAKSAVFQRYGYLYEAQAVLCDLAALVLLLSIARRHWPEHFGSLAAGYLGITTMLWPVLFVRLDIALTALLMAWAWFWTKADEASAVEKSPQAQRWRLLSYGALGLGISFKLMPVIMAPFLLLVELRSPRPWRRTAQALVAMSATALLPFALHVPSAGSGILRLFAYHGQRGIQVESLYASVFALAAGWQLEFENSFGSWNVVTDWTPLLKTCSTLLLLALLAGLGLWSVRGGRHYTSQQALAVACLAMCGSVILTKVLSPQYFVWALPLALLLSAEVLPRRWTYSWLVAAGLIAVARATTWVFPYHYGELLEPSIWHAPWVILLARNLLYLAIVAGLGARLLAADRPSRLPERLPPERVLRADSVHVGRHSRRRSTSGIS